MERGEDISSLVDELGLILFLADGFDHANTAIHSNFLLIFNININLDKVLYNGITILLINIIYYNILIKPKIIYFYIPPFALFIRKMLIYCCRIHQFFIDLKLLYFIFIFQDFFFFFYYHLTFCFCFLFLRKLSFKDCHIPKYWNYYQIREFLCDVSFVFEDK